MQRTKDVNPGYPAVPGTTNNCAKCADVVVDILNGADPATARAARGAISELEFAADQFFATQELVLDAAKNWRKVPDQLTVEKAMQATPPGSHGRLWGLRDGRVGHLINVWNDGKRAWFVDGQTGRIQWVENGKLFELDTLSGKIGPAGDGGYTGFRLLLSDF